MNTNQLIAQLKGLEYEAWLRTAAMASLEQETGEFDYTVERIKAEGQTAAFSLVLELVTAQEGAAQ